MKRLITVLILFIFFSSCSNQDEKRTFERTAVIYNGLQERKEEKFSANVTHGENLVYKYVSQIDSTKIVDIQFDKNLQELYFGPEQFIRSDRAGFIEEKLSDDLFYYYDSKEPVVDGTGPLLFNEEYGLLAIYNVFGPTIIFLNDETIELKKRVLDSLNQ